MTGSTAWILDFGSGLRAAVSEREMLHLVDSPDLHDVPVTPLHCRQIIIWNGETLPVVDFAAWVNGYCDQKTVAFLGIFGYQERPGSEPQRGALILREIPWRLTVSDDQASDLPHAPKQWEEVALACFENAAGSRIPIIDLAKVFSRDICDRQIASSS